MKKIIYTLTILLVWWGCKKPYQPVAITTDSNYLVVEGIINTGNDSTIIRLSRTVKVSSSQRSTPELNAMVIIESDAGATYGLPDAGNGYYKAGPLGLSSSNKYRLRITTATGKTYESDLIEARNSPPIDSVYYRILNNGVEIYADTHDPTNSTKYYRWEYESTYQYHSAFNSFLKLVTTPQDTVLGRTIPEHIYVCYRGNKSSTILINSSAKLSQDVITQNPIAFIASNAEELESRYSILVKQYALTPGAFSYFQQLKKNSEQLGSIFDAQPSELPGNIHCLTNPSEPVLGYITAGAPTQLRMYIRNRDLPAWLTDSPYSGCKLDTDLFARPQGSTVVNEVQEYIYTGVHIPIFVIQPQGAPKPDGYTASVPGCVDCTLRGTNIKPAFWVDE
ncbi:DUF4249 domain-containing protein [Mucilaginibacter ginsenosidivorans]|uniref:DUF4249 domain-containing protein n=1 Tax=Mucilaginibacter ginsenosidivorans TaxID=398053 RepID=A0A5B8URB5_9SPHI|nr:DUF4249 domain-containing protein [Mucilaginibacter ginsenosidivorans]QEC61388.1 DUF4249 domain-containing protein [Mucilaginibacter ginsenosidivorans]